MCDVMMWFKSQKEVFDQNFEVMCQFTTWCTFSANISILLVISAHFTKVSHHLSNSNSKVTKYDFHEPTNFY